MVLIEPLDQVLEKLRRTTTTMPVNQLTELISKLLRNRKMLPLLSVGITKQPLDALSSQIETSGVNAIGDRKDALGTLVDLIGHAEPPTTLASITN
jgi:hypothetical protein